MAFNYPCDLDRVDIVLPRSAHDRMYVSLNNKKQLLNAEGNNGYAYCVAGTTRDGLQQSIDLMRDPADVVDDGEVVTMSVIELLHRWRSFILDGEPTLLLGCEDYWCESALCSPNGVLYPHPYTMISYLVDKDGNKITNEFGSLLSAGSLTQLLMFVMYPTPSLLERFYKNDITIKAEPLIYLAEEHKLIVCEGSTCSTSMAIAHSSIGRQKNEGDNNV